MNYLIVIDMQVDFINGALGSNQAKAIVPVVADKVKNFNGRVIFTRDTHLDNYLQTQEGKNLPVPHCIKNTDGWHICDELKQYAKTVIDKQTFGSMELADIIANGGYEAIEFVGLCTDICVISNVMLAKAADVNAVVTVDSKACAGVTPDSHNNALDAMKMCQVRVL